MWQLDQKELRKKKLSKKNKRQIYEEISLYN
jgi:hypothetical protein